MIKKGIVLAVLALGFAACQEKKTTIEETQTITTDTLSKDQPVADGHNAENSLDWDGTYEGTLPCADCPGIATSIVLKKDATFELTSTYLESNLKVNDKGTFEWSKDGSSVRLKGKETDIQLKVGENQLFYLDQDGNQIDGPLKEHYILKKK